MILTREEKAAILLMRDIKNNPLKGCKIGNYIGLGWEVSGRLTVGDYGYFDIDFTIDCCDGVMGFYVGNVFQSTFKFNPDKAFCAKSLQAFANRLDDKLAPVVEYLRKIEEQVKD